MNHPAREILVVALLLIGTISSTAPASASQAVADGGGGATQTGSRESVLDTIKAVAQSISAAGAGQLAVVASLTVTAVRAVGIAGSIILVLGF